MRHLWRQVGWHRLVVDVSGSIKLCDRHLVSVHKPNPCNRTAFYVHFVSGHLSLFGRENVVGVNSSICTRVCHVRLFPPQQPMLPSVPLPTLAAPPPPRSLPAPTPHISRAYF